MKSLPRILLTLLMLPSALTMQAETGSLQNDDIVTESRYDSLKLQSSRYSQMLHRYQRFWHGLIPSQIKVQYAGSIGLCSVAAGWHYGPQHRIWETDLFFGYLPKYNSRTARTTLTAKQSYVPFRVRLDDDLDIEPLACGLFLSTIFGEEFWGSQPSKYPKKYYGFSTKIRANMFIGQRLRFGIPSSLRKRHNAISFYYEFSTNELYLISYISNSSLPLKDILSLNCGLKFELF
ncbi:MAG: hypothetical protein IJ244_05505 [Bacteroidaceae bacterium]|nr:hypothetical protein [Bacteroidaceae bacterium]